MTDGDLSPPPGAAITAMAVDHVLLTYLYLDDGNLDGYASLLAENVRLRRPELPELHGRDAVLAQMARIAGPPGRHRLYRVIADGDCVAAEGRCVGPAAPCTRDVDFVDICTVSATGLLVDQRRYYGLPAKQTTDP